MDVKRYFGLYDKHGGRIMCLRPEQSFRVPCLYALDHSPTQMIDTLQVMLSPDMISHITPIARIGKGVFTSLPIPAASPTCILNPASGCMPGCAPRCCQSKYSQGKGWQHPRSARLSTRCCTQEGWIL